MSALTHDNRCERRPGGEYEGMGVPCHCPARAGTPELTPPAVVRLNLQGNLALTAADVPGSRITLGELLADLLDAIDRHGEDSEVVTFQTNADGARWGRISYNPFDAAAAPEDFL